MPFLHVPQTLGYLLGTWVYRSGWLAEGVFGDAFAVLVREAAGMPLETLAARHFGVDLTKPAFWRQAVQPALADVDEFLALSV